MKENASGKFILLSSQLAAYCMYSVENITDGETAHEPYLRFIIQAGITNVYTI